MVEPGTAELEREEAEAGVPLGEVVGAALQSGDLEDELLGEVTPRRWAPMWLLGTPTFASSCSRLGPA